MRKTARLDERPDARHDQRSHDSGSARDRVRQESNVYCAQCGTANQPGEETCQVCGSPLGRATGERRCATCGAPMNEHDRYCRSCGALAPNEPTTHGYDPGPSFVDDTDLEIDESALPTWLRELAASAPAADSGTQRRPITAPLHPETGHSPAPEATRPPTAWAPPAPGQPPTETQPPQPEPSVNDTLSLISEDDLPDWLRAIGDEAEPIPTPPDDSQPTTPTGPETMAAPSPPPIPSVSRAWLSSSPARATATDATADDFRPLEAETAPAASAPSATPSTPTPQPAPGVTPPSAPTAPAAPATLNEPQAPGTTPEASSQRRIILLAAALAVLIVVLVVLFATGLI